MYKKSRNHVSQLIRTNLDREAENADTPGIYLIQENADTPGIYLIQENADTPGIYLIQENPDIL